MLICPKLWKYFTIFPTQTNQPYHVSCILLSNVVLNNVFLCQSICYHMILQNSQNGFSVPNTSPYWVYGIYKDHCQPRSQTIRYDCDIEGIFWNNQDRISYGPCNDHSLINPIKPLREPEEPSPTEFFKTKVQEMQNTWLETTVSNKKAYLLKFSSMFSDVSHDVDP